MVTVERLMELAEHYQEIFNLQSWLIGCYIEPIAGMPVDGAWGNIVVEHEYMRARLTVGVETPEDQLQHVVCHEVAHILVTMIVDNALYLVDELDKKRRKRERHILERESERATEMMARAIRRLEKRETT